MLFFLFSGCSLLFNPVDKCTSSSTCKKAFGDNYTCNMNTGYCEQGDDNGDGPIAHNRCQTFPDNLIEDWNDYKDKPVVGAMMSPSAYWAEYKSIEMAIRGMEGKHANAVLCDNSQDEDGQFDGLSNFDATEELTNYLLNNFETPIVVGPGSSTLAKAALPKLVAERAVLVSAMATGDGLTNFSNGGGDYTAFWRTSSPASLQAQALVQYFEQDQGYEDILILHEHEEGQVSQDTDRIYLADDLDRLLETAGYNVWVGAHDSFLPISAQPWLELARPSNNIDAIVFLSDFPQNHRQFVESLQDEQPDFMEGTLDIYLGQNGLSSSLLGAIQESTNESWGLFYTFGPGLPTGTNPRPNRYGDFAGQLMAYASADAGNNPFAAYAYDAMMLAHYASAWGQLLSETERESVSGNLVYQGLLNISGGPNDLFPLEPDDFDRAWEMLGNLVPINAYGASGPLDFGELQQVNASFGDHELISPIDILQISPGEATLIAQCDIDECTISDRR